jgi:hypothetical protein
MWEKQGGYAVDQMRLYLRMPRREMLFTEVPRPSG